MIAQQLAHGSETGKSQQEGAHYAGRGKGARQIDLTERANFAEAAGGAVRRQKRSPMRTTQYACPARYKSFAGAENELRCGVIGRPPGR